MKYNGVSRLHHCPFSANPFYINGISIIVKFIVLPVDGVMSSLTLAGSGVVLGDTTHEP